MTSMESQKKEQGIIIQIAENFEDIKVNSHKINELVNVICKRFGLSQATVSIAVVDDEEIIRVNKEFLNHDYVTDVISFDLSDEHDSSVFELVVNGQMAVRQAAKRGHNAESELSLYITHGMLHNLGFDDAQAAQSKEMHRTEDEILKSLGIGEVYGLQ